MKQATLTVEDLNLNFIESNRNAVGTLFFFHGNSGSSNTWHRQLGSPLLASYHLIAFDLPGHGLSGEPKDLLKGYSLPGLGRIMAAAVNKLAEPFSYILVGFSLGSNVLCEMMACGLKPQGIVLISPCVLRAASDLAFIFRANPNSACFFSEQVTDEQLELLVNECFYQLSAAINDTFKYDFRNTKPAFRSMLQKTASEGAYTNEISTLRNYNKPILLVFGKEDKIVNPDYLDAIALPLWHESIVKLHDAGHFVHVDASMATTELIAAYAREIFKSTHASPHNA